MSVTITGIIISVAGTFLLKAGFSEVCSNEVIANAPMVIGGIVAWYGRVRKGDISIFGIRKEV